MSVGDSGRVAPGVLVSCDWLAANLDTPGLVIVEVDEQPLLYRLGHIPGAHGIDWRADLQHPLVRDIPDEDAVGRLWRRLGIDRDSIVVLYGDKNNWYACFGYWLFWLYGLRNLHILDGGRPLWLNQNLPITRDEPFAVPGQTPRPRLDGATRAGFWHVLATRGAGAQLIDVRSPEEYRGELLTEPGYPEEAAQRPGHIPGAVNVPWARATQLDGRFKPAHELLALYGALGRADRTTITYCRIGERSAHTWFVLHALLGFSDVRNYDGSWTEWGSIMGMPIELGEQVGELSVPWPAPVGLDAPSALYQPLAAEV
ncbi:MAG TPA: sulfurtransferase [Solirubrobacteraceae bacterium]|nr:sulfurtransferase [Solirubrobacteraceae bacterium]